MSEWKQWSQHPFVIGLILFAVTFMTFSISLSNGWVNWDDPTYVLNNSLITSDSIQWKAIFETDQVLGIYHPVTLISYAIDYQIWGLDPFGFHFTNVLFHSLNTVLVFVVIRKLKASVLVAAFTAFLFGIHPMHVESVAWISERKDVLYVFFLLLAWLSYLQIRSSINSKKWLWYGAILGLFALSILSKPIAFVFPVILVLTDVLLDGKLRIISLGNKILIAVFALAAVFLAQWGQAESGSIAMNQEHPVPTFFYGSYNLIVYGFKAFVPIELSVFHPFPVDSSMNWLFYASVVPLAVFLWLLYWSFRNSKKLFFGLAFFVMTIAPLLQIIPFGKALTSERYTYLPYIGLFYLFACGLQYLKDQKRFHPVLFLVIITVFPVLLGSQSIDQQRKWKNGETLWTSAIQTYPNAYFPYLCRGRYFKQKDQLNLAFNDFQKSVQFHPNAEAYYELGLLYEAREDFENALDRYLKATQGTTPYPKAHLNAAKIFGMKGDGDKAKHHFERAIEIDPQYSLAYFNYAVLLKMQGKLSQALKAINKAISLEPKNTRYLEIRAAIHTDLGSRSEAIRDFTKVLSNQPENGVAHFYLGMNYALSNQNEKARMSFTKAIRYGYPVPDKVRAEFNLPVPN